MPNVHLTPQMQDFAEREIAAGAYATLSEVVRAAMRTLMEQRGAAAVQVRKRAVGGATAEPERGAAGAFDPRGREAEAFEWARAASSRDDGPSRP